LHEASRGRSAGVWLGMEGKETCQSNGWQMPRAQRKKEGPLRILESSPDGTSLVAEDGRAKWRIRVGLKMISGHDLPGNLLGRPHIQSGHLEESPAAFRWRANSEQCRAHSSNNLFPIADMDFKR
jgi:hypothetical protein